MDAVGAEADGSGSKITFGAATVTTSGDGAIGLSAVNGGVITAATGTTATISTSGTNSKSTGLSAFGVFADGAGSQINLAGATITTTGQGAVGLYASSTGEGVGGGAITVSGPLSVTTGTAPYAYGAWAQGAGSTIALDGQSTFTINGGAYTLYATQGGAITTGATTSGGSLAITVNGDNGGGVQVDNSTGSGSPSSITLKGPTTIILNGSSDVGLFAAGGAPFVQGPPLSVQGPTSITVYGPSSTGVAALSSAINVSGQMNVNVSQATSAAFALSGVSPSISATGGGTVSTVGNAIEFLNASNATATFDSFNITNKTGDLIFADPSVAKVNFNDTVANAGNGVLLNATGGSFVTLNATASTLTGTIQTDPTSTTNFNLTSGSTGSNWTMTGSSTVSNLAVTNSTIVFFSPPGSGGPFKTLTVNNYTGSGANITMNAALGSGVGDQIVINGGKAIGQTLLTINNTGGSGATVPLVVTVNGGTTNFNAFALAGTGTVVAGDYSYSLQYQQSNQDWLLVPTALPPRSDIANSVNSITKSIQQQIITGRVLTSILLGATEQVNCSNCSSGFGSIGSYALGAHGRWSLTDAVTVMGGFSYNAYSADGISVTNAPTFAGSVIYDPVNFGRSRPFVELGGGVVPFEQVHYSRSYQNGLIPAVGEGSGVDRSSRLVRPGRVGRPDNADRRSRGLHRHQPKLAQRGRLHRISRRRKSFSGHSPDRN